MDDGRDDYHGRPRHPLVSSYRTANQKHGCRRLVAGGRDLVYRLAPRGAFVGTGAAG